MKSLRISRFSSLRQLPSPYFTSFRSINDLVVNGNADNFLSYDFYPSKASNPKDTAIFLHGILGSKRNWKSVCQDFVRKGDDLQAFAFDHRGHGCSTGMSTINDDNTVLQCAFDLEDTLHSHLNIQPTILSAHSFGGKVALHYLNNRMLEHHPLPKHTWILDSMPGLYPAKMNDAQSASVVNVFRVLEKLPKIFPSRDGMIQELQEHGIESSVAQWLATSMVPYGDQFTWCFNFDAINSMFHDFLSQEMWNFLETYDGECVIHFVRSGKNPSWPEEYVNRLKDLQANNSKIKFHVMPNVGHLLHMEDRVGLVTLIMSESGLI